MHTDTGQGKGKKSMVVVHKLSKEKREQELMGKDKNMNTEWDGAMQGEKK